MTQLFIPITASRLMNSNDFDKILVNDTGTNITITIGMDNDIGINGASSIAVGLFQGGAGTVAFAAATNVTINGTPPVIAQYGTLPIMRVGANTWAYL